MNSEVGTGRDLPRSTPATYDGARPVFLPKLLAFLCTLTAACGGGGEASQDPSHGRLADGALARVEVVRGRGEVGDGLLDAVRREVATGVHDLQQAFPGQPHRPCFVFVHGSRADLPDELVANLHADAAGFTLLGRHQIHLVVGDIRRSGASLAGVVQHELVHELLDQQVEPHGKLLPRWLHEGLAQNLAGDTYLGASENDLAWRVPVGQMLSFGDLRDDFPRSERDLRLAYAQSFSYVSWLVREFGLPCVLTAAKATDDLTSFERALCGYSQRSSMQLRLGWESYLENGSGASWRVLMEQSFSLLMVFALPLLVLALMRRLAADSRAAKRLAQSSVRDELLAEAAMAPNAPLLTTTGAASQAVVGPADDDAARNALPPAEEGGDRRGSW